jgi:hypothetical protein
MKASAATAAIKAARAQFGRVPTAVPRVLFQFGDIAVTLPKIPANNGFLTTLYCEYVGTIRVIPARP